MKCPHCNQEHPEGTKFCPYSGKLIEHQYCKNKECPICEKEALPYDYDYCPNCGKEIYRIFPKRHKSKGVLYYLKRISIWTILGVAGTWVSVYLMKTAPDVGEQISAELQNLYKEKQINAELQELYKDFETLRPVHVPDSLNKVTEVRKLQDFQREFDVYKLLTYSLDYSEMSSDSAEVKVLVHESRFRKFLSYMVETEVLSQIIHDICDYKSLVDTDFVYAVDANQLDSIKNLQKAIVHDLKKVLDDNSLQSELNALGSELEKGEISKEMTVKRIGTLREDMGAKLESVYAGENFLKLVEAQKKFYKSFYLLTNIRLLKIQRSREVLVTIENVNEFNEQDENRIY